MATLIKDNSERKSAAHVVYTVEGVRGNFYIPATAIDGVAPDSFEVSGITFVAGGSAPKVAKAKMTDEEKAAAKQAAAEARKNQTPEQKVAAAKLRAQRAVERAAKLEASMTEPAAV